MGVSLLAKSPPATADLSCQSVPWNLYDISQRVSPVISSFLDGARQQAIQAVNTRLIELYWQVGGYISRKLDWLNGGIAW